MNFILSAESWKNLLIDTGVVAAAVGATILGQQHLSIEHPFLAVIGFSVVGNYLRKVVNLSK